MTQPLTQLPASDPTLLLRYRDRQYSAELIATALLHFDFFSWLKEHPPTPASIQSPKAGKEPGGPPHPMRVFSGILRVVLRGQPAHFQGRAEITNVTEKAHHIFGAFG